MAAQTWTGAISNDWTLGSNWSGGVAPAGGNVTINTTSPNPTVLGTGGAAAATSNALNVGVTGGTGNLTIQNGSVLTSTATTLVFIGQDAGSSGTMTVTGSGTRWTLLGAPGLNSIHVGGVGGTGTLQIVNGATATQTGDVAIGRLGGTGSLIIASGGAVTTGRDAFIGRLAGGTGSVTVDGAGSQWTIANGLFVGNGGTGTLSINNGAQVTAGTTFVGDPGGSGTLNINRGTLATISLRGGAGASQANFDNAVIRARANNASFITGFTGTELNLQAGGLIIDTSTFSVATDSTSAFAGAGGLTTTGSGTFTTLANNTYLGQTWVQSGRLALTGTGAIANSSRVVADGLFDISGVAGVGTSIRSLAGSGNVALGARTLTLTAANDTFSGVIGGSGGLTVAGGAQVLTGANTYTGGTTITAGSLQLGAGGTSGSIVGDVTNNGALAFNRSNTYSFGGVISGTGVVNQIGSGTTVLTGVNSYSGGTNINAGVLSVSSNANLGAAGGAVTFNGGRLTNTASFTANRPTTINAATGTFETLGDLTWAGSITGAGTLVKEGDASLILTGASNHAGGTIVSAGTVQIGNGGATGSITGPVLNNATLAFNRNNTYEFAGEISGSGVVNQIGTGTTVLTANNSYTGATTISAGTLQLGNGGASGSVLGNITNNGALAFNRSDAFVLPGVVTGTGSVNQIGTGTTVLEGTNTYTGGTNVTAGALRLGNGGTTGSIVGDVVNNGALEFFRSNRMDFDGVISGSGAIRQIGSGLTNLTGNSSAFAGSTSVEAGTLAVNGSLCGDMNVLGGGRLQGTGTVCTTNNTGTVAPGNSIGTLTVNGNYTGNNGLLEMETYLGGDASPTDRLVVTGNTAGTTRVRVINVGGPGAPTVEGIRIVEVGGLSNGNFVLQGDYVFQGMPAMIAGAYSYVLQRNGISTPTDGDWYLRSSLPAPPTPTPPEAPPAPAPSPPSPSAGPIFAPTVPVYENYARVMLSLNELPTMEQRIGHRFRTSPDAMASMGVADASAWAVSPLWARVEGGHKNLNPVATARSTLDLDHYKFEGGADLVNVEGAAGRWLVGLVGNYIEGNANVFSLFGDGKIKVTGGGVGATATWLGHSGFYFDGQARASWYNGDLRSAAIGSIISGNDGTGYAFGAELGQRFSIGDGWSITPQMQVNYGKVDYDNFVDRFGGQADLRSSESLLGRGGVAINHQRTWKDAAGQQVRSDVYGIANAYYEFLSGNSTLVSGTPFASSIDRLWGSVGAGGTFSWANDKYAVYGELSYNTSLIEPGDSYAYKGTAGFRMRW